MRPVLLVTLSLLLLTTLAPLKLHADHLPADESADRDDYLRSTRLGITHISLTGETTSDERYHKALELGAGWNRWPLYWNQIEVEAGEFNWDSYDEQVARDLHFGLKINAILLGTPEFYREGSRISSIYKPIFSDGSDTPGEEKTIHPENHWANFVFQAVKRYKPGGDLAREAGWAEDAGIRLWEVWNEPDHQPFWDGTINDYARLLQTAYLVIKLVDPDAQVMFGGLLYSGADNWLARVLAIYENDPLREDNNWYMDIVAVHNYSYPWRSNWLVFWVKQTLKAYKINRPVWLNETGVPAWDDYPGPLWASAPEERQLRATAEQQAAFLMQSAAYAWAAGAEAVFFHQLYDDCGNQPPGTDFPFSRINRCEAGQLCFGDAFGLFRNERGAVCFSQHPAPGSARPAADAFRLLADLLGTGTLANPVVSDDEETIAIGFDRLETRERLTVVWNRSFEAATIRVPAYGDRGRLYSLKNDLAIYPSAQGVYEILLPPATPDYFPRLEPGDVTAIGGPPFILVETITGRPTITPIPSATPRPTATSVPETTTEEAPAQ